MNISVLKKQGSHYIFLFRSIMNINCINIMAVILCFVIAFFVFFVFKKREIYFVWSLIAPRISGDAVCDTIISYRDFTH